MRLLQFLSLFILYSQISCQIDSRCQLCFNEATFVKYCSYAQDVSAGKCCLSSSTSDNCLKEWFYCSNKASQSFSYHKYSFCSFDPLKCGIANRNLRAKEVPQTIFTSLVMVNNDICPYQIITDSHLTFNTQVKIVITQAVNTDVYLLVGSSINDIETQQKVVTGQEVFFESDKIGILILKATFDFPMVEFTYQSEPIISNAEWIGIIIGASFSYFLALLGGIILLTRWITLKRLREMQSPNIVYFLKKKVIQYSQVHQESNDYDKKTLPPPAFKPYDPILSPKNMAKPMPLMDLGFNNDNFMGQTDQMTRLGSPLGDMRPITQHSKIAPIGNQFSSTAQDQMKVNIRPYKFDIE